MIVCVFFPWPVNTLETDHISLMPGCLHFPSSKISKLPILRNDWLEHLWLDLDYCPYHEKLVHYSTTQAPPAAWGTLNSTTYMAVNEWRKAWYHLSSVTKVNSFTLWQSMNEEKHIICLQSQNFTLWPSMNEKKHDIICLQSQSFT